MSAQPEPDASAGDGASAAADGADELRAITFDAPESAGVGTVIVMLQDMSPEVMATTYSPAPETTHARSLGDSRSFVAILAPTASSAAGFLSSQPSGAFVLVKDEDGSLTVHIKFHRALRTAVVLKGKDLKKANGTIEWSAQLPPNEGVFAGTVPPVHRMYLSGYLFDQLEHCWCHFLPRVQSIVFEMCCEGSLDEKACLDNCAEMLAASTPPQLLIALLPTSCGFCLLNGMSGRREGSSNAYELRQVEFDFCKFCVTVSDGTFKPSALLMGTHMSSRRAMGPDLSFQSLLDNFLFPDRVKLKGTAVSTGPATSLEAQSYIELSPNDTEMDLLRAVCEACAQVHPLATTSFPAALLPAMDTLYRYYAGSYSGIQGNSNQCLRSQWSDSKAELISKALPVWIELMAATAVTSEAISVSSPPGTIDMSSEQMTIKHPLTRLTRAIRFILTIIARQSGEGVTSQMISLVFRLFSLRSKVPTELGALIRDLCALNPTFQRLFANAHGALLLWNATRSTSKPELENPVSSTEPNEKAPSTARDQKMLGLLKPKLTSEHRPSLFPMSRKMHGPRNRSLVDTSTKTGMSNTRFYSFFQLNPWSIESELLKKLERHQFNEQHLSKTGAARVYCSCRNGEMLHQEGNENSGCALSSTDDAIEWYDPGEKAIKMVTFEVILQLGEHFLLQDPCLGSWDKDVAMLVRCEKLHNNLAEEIFHTSLQLSGTLLSQEERSSLKCRRCVAIECISVLFELESKRRRLMATTVGEKKYLPFVFAIQSALREVNETLASEKPELAGQHVLDACVAIVRWIPISLLEEWFVLSLGEIFTTVAALNEAIARCEHTIILALVPLIGRLMEIFRFLLERISDLDLQMLLLRLLDRGFEPVVPLLHTAVAIDSSNNYVVQYQVLGFLHAFALVNRYLPLKNTWLLVHAHDQKQAVTNDDNEEMEQRRSELLQQFLVFDEKNEISTWEFLLRLAFSSYDAPVTCSADEVTSLPTIQTLLVFKEPYIPGDGEEDNVVDAHYFPTIEMALTLQRTLYASITPEYNVEIDMAYAVARHIAGLTESCRRIDDTEKPHSGANLRRNIELHLDCLIALANRRCVIPEIQAALDSNSVLSVIVNHLLWSRPSTPRHDEIPTLQHAAQNAATGLDPRVPDQHQLDRGDSSTTLGSVPQLRLQLEKINSNGYDTCRTSSSDCNLDGALSSLSLNTASCASILARDSKLHALAIVFLLSYMLLEPSHELDDAYCSRYAPGVDQNGSNDGNGAQSDLLWQLQRHLDSTVQLDMRHFERILFNMETTLSFVTASRASAIRDIVRLLSPVAFDRTLYSLRERVHTYRSSHGENEDCEGEKSRSERTPRHEYIAKGATASVYRSTSALLYPKSIAVKLIGYHCDGDRCVAGSVINEVSILKALRGERAALQLVDFGKNDEERSYEIVTEWCPCTLAEWRSRMVRHSGTLPTAAEDPNESGQQGTSVPFRALVLMILRCFRKVCACLARIHDRGVCHFDIKSANLFLRTSASDFSHRLLLHGEQHELETEAATLVGCVCFGDFGEAMLASPQQSCLPFASGSPTDASLSSLPTEETKEPSPSFLLSRTRGTEAIKSPEVFRIRGNEASKTKVTFASDVWSMGCLLYELVVQELLFEQDEWPALYAHLVASPDDCSVLREDHVRKLNAALAPSDDYEQRIVNGVAELCALLLDRQPPRRPTLGSIVHRVSALIQTALKLAVTADEKEFIKRMALSKAESAAALAARCSTAALKCDAPSELTSFRSMQPPRPPQARKDGHGSLMVAPRLFWNLFVVGTLPRRPHSRMDASSIDITACKAFEVAHAHEFVHVVYFSWLSGGEDAASAPLEPPSPCEASASGVFARIYEDERRTILHVHPRIRRAYRATAKHRGAGAEPHLAAQMLQGLMQQAPELFPVLQRRLRQEPGRVAITCAPHGLAAETDATDAKHLEDVMLSALLFFLERSLAVSPLDALALFARTASPRFVAFPRRAFAQQLSALACRQQQTRRRVAEAAAAAAADELKARARVCLCGASAVAVRLSALRHALASQRCSCATADASGGCASFHPFACSASCGRAGSRAGGPLEDAAQPAPAAFVHDAWEQQLLLPMQVAHGSVHMGLDPCAAWVLVDRAAVARLGSLLAWPEEGARAADAPASAGVKRRPSAPSLGALRRLLSKSGDSPRPPSAAHGPAAPPGGEELLRGLSARAVRVAGAAWTLYECALCRLPMLAASDEHERGLLAVPVDAHAGTRP